MTDIAKSIVAIKKDAKFSCNAEDLDQITWFDGNPTNITKEQIVAKQAELVADFDAKKYQRDRQKHENPNGDNTYPKIEDQLDMIYHDQVDGTNTFKDAIQAVKDAYPKP